MEHTKRVVLLIDMDCFYCQVEENLDPNLKGEPIAVVQYNQWRGGGIIAVNYPARELGVTRHMRGSDAQKICPNIKLVKVPQVRGKADLTKYRDAGKRVADVLQSFTINLERASVDEAYLDITEIVENKLQNKELITVDKLSNTFVVGSATEDFVYNVNNSIDYNENNVKLALGGIVSEEIRAQVYEITGYRCSAGIAHNKILAKLVCGLHKPNKQTILPDEAISEFYQKLPIKKIKSLGGKFGSSVAEKLGIEYMGELLKFSQKELTNKFDEKSACWLYNIARGIDMEPVTTRLVPKSIGCCKRFPGKAKLSTQKDVEHWFNELSEELAERLEKDFQDNNRKAKQMVISFSQKTNRELVSGTRTHPLSSYEQNKIFEDGMKVIQKNCLKPDGSYFITFLGISAANFQDVKKVKEISFYFKSMNENLKNVENINGDKQLKANHITNETINCISQQTSGTLKENASQSDSVYSNTTEEEDMNREDVIYYEEINPNSITDQNFIDTEENASNTSEDSISQEINGEKNNEDSIKNNPAPTSFFTKYFDDNLRRNCDMSKIIESAQGSSKDGMNKIEDTEISSDIKPAYEEKQVNETRTCSDCGESIHDLEYQSHMDYHFAVKLSKEEADLHKIENKMSPKNPTKIKNGKTTSRKKQKEDSSSKSKPILEYFKDNPDQIESGNSEKCSECNKRIRLEEWDVHADFHAAKKLHLEINISKSSTQSVNGTSKSKGQTNMMSFFKRS